VRATKVRPVPTRWGCVRVCNGWFREIRDYMVRRRYVFEPMEFVG